MIPHRAVLAIAAALLAAGLSARPALAQGPTIPVRMVLQDRDRDWVPDRLGDTVTVEGVVTSEAQMVGVDAALVNFQDRTRGIMLFSEDAATFEGLVRSDSVRATGVVTQYLGGEELVVTRIERLGAGVMPEPRDLLAADLQRERYTGELVRLEGRLETVRTYREWVAAELRDRSGTITVHVSAGWLTDPSFARRLEQGGRVRLVGVASQRSDSAHAGYELFPRGVDDFDFPARPPYAALAFAILIATILVLAWWRRAAVSRARELQALTEELERSRNHLRSSEALLRSLVENAADSVAIVDGEGRITYQSPASERMLGWTPAEVVGREVTDLVAEEDHARLRELVTDLSRADGETRELEIRARTRGGSWKLLEVTATGRFGDPAVRGIVLNARDVTLHKAMENRLRQADRLEVVGRLAGGIAHDFNNVMTAIRGHAEIALETIPGEVPGREEIREVVHGADRATELTRQLLAFSRQQVMKPRVVSAPALIRGVLPMIRRLIGEDLDLVVDLPEAPCRIRVDPAQFEQVLMNLVVNARDAMAAGGQLRVEVADVEPSAVDLPDPAAAPPRWVRLRVTDTGAGMSEEVLAHIFEPFFTTKELGKGTGLGLATLYGIVTQSEGEVRARSEVGVGSRFDVFFPLVDGPQVAEEKSPAPPTVERAAGELVLLVEDEKTVRDLTRRILERNGYRVLEADTPAAALGIAASADARIDLLLTDVVMPGMSGSQLAARLRADRPDLPVLFTSGYMDDEVIRRGVDRGGTAFLGKPFTRAQLLLAVRQSLAASQPESVS